MANGKLLISAEGKEIIDRLMAILNINHRPTIVKIALAKGIAISEGPEPIQSYPTKDNWLFGDGIIKGNEYLLFKHLIINEQQLQIEQDMIDKYFVHYIEKGLRELNRIEKEKNSLEDFRLALI